MNPQISIITVTYNAAQYIEKTLLSVLSQTVYDEQIEYIIVDGGSTDGTLQIIEPYRDRISHIVSEPDRGLYDAMNKGARMASAPWILFLNADDTLFDQQTIELLHLDRRTPDHIIYGDHIITHRDGSEQPSKAAPFWEHPELIAGLGICHQSLYMPTQFMQRHPFAWEEFRYCADFEAVHYWYSQGKRFDYIEKPLCRFEKGEGFSSRPEVWLRLLDENARITGRRHSLTYYKIWLRYKLGIH